MDRFGFLPLMDVVIFGEFLPMFLFDDLKINLVIPEGTFVSIFGLLNLLKPVCARHRSSYLF